MTNIPYELKTSFTEPSFFNEGRSGRNNNFFRTLDRVRTVLAGATLGSTIDFPNMHHTAHLITQVFGDLNEKNQ